MGGHISNPPGDLSRVSGVPERLLGLLALVPDISIYSRHSSEWEKSRSLYNLDIKTQPLAIVRPRDEAELSATVRFCAAADFPSRLVQADMTSSAEA